MTSSIGNILIIASIICGFINFFIKGKIVYISQSILVIFAAILLLIAFITSDFSVQNVLFYSSTTKPLLYKIAGLWTSHSSSLVFWSSMLSIVTMISIIYEEDPVISKINSKIFGSFLSLMMLYIYLTANPFIPVPNPPKEGLGLNPVLQDIAVSIHPPMLYLGYVSYIVPFAYCIAMLITGKMQKQYLEKCMLFSKIGLFALTSGIGLGSWWAYRELGWGGYWFFDPVENISLMPWLLGIALHHSLIISCRNGKMTQASIALGLLNFVLIIFGMMIVRSGILLSVHSFASNISGGIYVIGAFGIVVLIICGLYWIRIPTLIIPGHKANDTINEKSIFYGSILLYLATLSIFIGTIYPIIYQFILGYNISIDNGYFHVIFLPLGVIITIFSLWVVFINKASKKTSMIVSHAGVGILVLGIILNSSFKKDMEFKGHVGDTMLFPGIAEVKLQNIRYGTAQNYHRQIAEFWINDGSETVILKPENRLYIIEELLSAESDIYSFVSKDIYAVLGQIEPDNTVHANIYLRPWMSLIWLGIFLTASGVLMSLDKKGK
jgi:cytochrome c-type biogenesis protein CcmF